MFGLGPTELIVIGVIIILIFGAKRIPEIGKGLGGALREFRNVKNELVATDDKDEKKKNSNPEDNVTQKLLEHVPGAKQVIDAKEKVEKVKEVMK